jgi:hypothetical protein
LYGVLRDAPDPLDKHLSRRSLASYGVKRGLANPVRLLLEARGLDPVRLGAQLAALLNGPA